MTSAKATHLDIFLRAHTIKLRKNEKEQPKEIKPPATSERWTKRCLIIDTETRTSVDQAQMFGMFCVLNQSFFPWEVLAAIGRLAAFCSVIMSLP